MAFKSTITLALFSFVLSLAAGRNYRSLGRLNYKANKFRCPNEGFHADANDCKIFYRCVDWNSNIFFRDFSEPALTAFQFSCVEGTVFDPDFNICNQPQETSRRECGGRAAQDIMNDQYPFTYSSTMGSGDGNPYHESSYSSYPYYEVSTRSPDNYPNEYENQISPDVNPSESNSECTAEGFFPVPGNCNKFMRCTDDGMGGFRKFVFRCGEGTVWDQKHLVCNYPYAVPGCGGMNGIPSGDGQGYPIASGSQNGNNQYQEQGFPGQQGNGPSQSGLPTTDNYPSAEGYPGQTQNQGYGMSPQQGNQGSEPAYYPSQGYPGQGNRPPTFTYPGQGNQPGYPGQQPNPEKYPQQGGYPGQQPNPGQYPQQGGYPGQQPNPEQYPQQGNYPGQNGPVNEGNKPYPTGYPQQGSQGGYPGPVNRPPSESYPNQEGNIPDQSGYPQQGNYPGQNGPANQGNKPYPTGYPQQGSQGGYPGQINRPSFGSNPNQQVNGPDQSNNAPPTGYPDSYPNQNGQAGFPSEGYPQGGYPGTDTPNQSQGYPDHGPEEFGDGNPVPTGNINECQSDGFFSVPGECMRFFRCVDNGKGGYFRHDFMCGPGTVWDQESVTCNHPWAVQRKDCSASLTTESTMDSSRSTSMQQQTTSNQNWSQSSSQTTSSFSNFTQSTSSTSYFNTSSSASSSSSSASTQSQTSSSSQGQMTSSTQEGQTQSTSNQQGSQSTQEQQTSVQSENSMTTPMRPENKPTTTRPEQGMTPASGDMTSAPLGSRPCQPDKSSSIKCDKAGFYAVPGNCKKFYRCVDWDGDKGERFSVYYFECGDGTIWDPALETCNHEESVYPPRDCRAQSEKGNQPQQTTEKSTGMTDPTKDKDKNTNAPEQATEESTPMTESTTSEETEASMQETSTNAKPTPTSESTGSTSPSTDMTTLSPTDFNEITTPLSSESTPGQTSMTSESTNPTESNTEGEMEPTSPGPDSSNEKPNQTSAECPALGEGQVAFVCPTGFRRHPKDCNLFYQCTISKEGDVNVMTLACKNDTVYDERKIQCLPQDETDPCPAKSGGRTRFYRRIEPEMTSVVPITTSESLCPHEGHFPYQGDCKRFFKCQKDREGKMQGYLYQCPEKYSFSESSARCEISSTLPKCSRFHQYLTPLNLKWMSSKVPTEIAR